MTRLARRESKPGSTPLRAENPSLSSTVPFKSDYNLANLSEESEGIWWHGKVTSRIGNQAHIKPVHNGHDSALAVWYNIPREGVLTALGVLTGLGKSETRELQEGCRVYYLVPTDETKMTRRCIFDDIIYEQYHPK